MRIAAWSLNAATVALAGYCTAGFVDGSGPAGWINQVQAAAFGAYSARLTAVVLLFAVAALYGVVATFVPARGDSRSPFANRLLFASARRRRPRGMSVRSLAATCAALVAAAWALGYGVWSWAGADGRRAGDEVTAFLVLCTAITVAIVLVFALAGWQLVRGRRETYALPRRQPA